VEALRSLQQLLERAATVENETAVLVVVPEEQ
jgi:hypothetical protein